MTAAETPEIIIALKLQQLAERFQRPSLRLQGYRVHTVGDRVTASICMSVRKANVKNEKRKCIIF